MYLMGGKHKMWKFLPGMKDQSKQLGQIGANEKLVWCGQSLGVCRENCLNGLSNHIL